MGFVGYGLTGFARTPSFTCAVLELTCLNAGDSFASIVAGIDAGRMAYDNVRKATFLPISTDTAELVLFGLTLAREMHLSPRPFSRCD